ncbi:hypothetical protein GCM10023144_37570 [Pigmentiphaga soli]|uniref:BrnA antitoxin family protein n=1 Tax=Pigmentiphaga soli TaxID=1007095 RepID=A0ABP8HHJ0_9BURK
MSASKNASAHTLKSDLSRVDTHEIDRGEYDELPDLTEDALKRAVVNKGGRPHSPSPKILLSVRYSREVVEFFRASGSGWQSRMDEVLREYVRRHGDVGGPTSEQLRTVRKKAAGA